jgi:hypothetical protein
LPSDRRSDVERLFTGRTVRIDTTHGGHRTAEWIRVDGATREGIWTGGRPSSLPTALGDYRCRLEEMETGDVLFNCGYSSFFDEWRSTSAARTNQERRFSESLRIPEPRADSRLIVEGRMDDGTFRTLLETTLRIEHIHDTAANLATESIDLSAERDPVTSVNLLFVAEGYVASARDKFIGDVERISDLLFQVEPYKSRKPAFNVRGLFAASQESGISDPTRGHQVETLLGASFDVFGIARYMLTFENQRLREAAAHTPYDCLIVLCNSDTYGGGGVFNQYACIAADAPHSQYLIAHELGHSLAGLADEYYTSLVTYDVEGRITAEPWNRNVTACSDRATLKWGHLVDADVPLPTPWEQQRYDELAGQVRSATASNETGNQARNLAKQMTELLENDRYYGRVGAFEGAAYRAKGAYRPELDCLMFSRSHSRFCRVCFEAISERIAELTQPA